MVASIVYFEKGSCQHQYSDPNQNFIPTSSFYHHEHQHNFHIQHPPTTRQHHHQPQQQQQQQQPKSSPNQHHHQSSQFTSVHLDLDQFNQQTKQLHDQIHYLNQQQAKQIRNQINSVHQPNSEPHFDFIVNSNYTDLEKASEQFVDLGRLVGKHQTPPKVIKITKTLAINKPVPVPVPIPVVKYVREQIPVETSHSGYHGIIGHPPTYTNNQNDHQHHPTTTEKPYEHVTYVPHRPIKTATSPGTAAVSYQSFSASTTPIPTTAASHDPSEYDTEPFYIRGPNKEMIKIVPVPYYVDEDGNRHEIKSSSSSQSHAPSSYDSHEFHTNHQQTSHSYPAYRPTPTPATYTASNDDKFKSYTFNQHHHHHPTPSYHGSFSSYDVPNVPTDPDSKYYYEQQTHNSDSDVGASALQSHHNQHNPSEVEDERQEQELCAEEYENYKYVSYEQ